MTAIVGLRVGEDVFIGADAAAVSGWEVRATTLPKVFRLDDFLIGFTSSFRMGNVLAHGLSVEARHGDEDPLDYLVRVFIEAVRDRFRTAGFMSIKDSVEHGGAFLLAYCGRLFEVDTDYQVNEMADGMQALGVGREYALGALRATGDTAPERRVYAALEAAAYFSGGVLPPFTVLRA